MKLHSFSVVVAAVLVGALGACGGTSGTDSGGNNNGNPPATTTPDAGGTDDTADAAPPPPPVDHGAPSSTYPAFKPDVPQLQNRGGPTLKSPKLVTVTWPGDTIASSLEAFGDAIGGTKYWSTAVGEYGIGAAVSGTANHVRMTTALPTGIADQDLDSVVDANVTGQTVGTFAPDATKWPAADANTLYLLYIPASAKFSLQGQDACSSNVGGYHTMTQNGGYYYAVIPECPRGKETALDVSTESASHEIAEAAVDPSQVAQAWYGLDKNHLAWSMFNIFQVENGDLCEFYQDSFYKETEANFAYQVQREWSNQSIAAGHAPCIPAPPGVYFNVTPFDLEPVSVTVRGAHRQAQGIKIAVGESKSFHIGFYSDAAMDPWSIVLHEGNPEGALLGVPATHNLAYSIDKSTGQNGEKAIVTVTMKTAPSTAAGAMPPYLVIESHSGSTVHSYPIAISTQ